MSTTITLTAFVGTTVAVLFVLSYVKKQKDSRLSEKLLKTFLSIICTKFHEASWNVLHMEKIKEDQTNEILKRMDVCRLRSELIFFMDNSPFYLDEYRIPYRDQKTREVINKTYPLLSSLHKNYKTKKISSEKLSEEFMAKFTEIISDVIKN